MAGKISKIENKKLIAFIGSALDVSEDIYNYANWAVDKNMLIEKLIGIKDYTNINGMGYGIEARENIPESSVIFKIPHEYCLNSKDFVFLLLVKKIELYTF